jgi:hypothetical protein
LTVFIGLVGLLVIVIALLDCFESILQPRRVTRPYRFARLYYIGLWALWRTVAARISTPRRQAAFFSVFGPLSLLGIFAMWVLGLIVGFAMLNFALRTSVHSPEGGTSFATYLYMSGTTFFTLGYGDVTPVTALGRAMAVGESGLGFGFLAAVLSYLPVLFQAYSRREVSIATLDARAGSPASAAQLLLRMARGGNMAAMDSFLREWEMWSANLLESHLSFPVLGYYRSQHDNQSWLAALTVVLDTCAILMTQVKGPGTYQAEVTFAIARHAAVDLTLVFRTPADGAELERLPASELARLREMLAAAGVELQEGAAAQTRLRELRGMYEPFVRALGARLLLSLPAIVPAGDGTADNWQRSAWMRPVPGIGSLPLGTGNDEHFG